MRGPNKNSQSVSGLYKMMPLENSRNSEVPGLVILLGDCFGGEGECMHQLVKADPERKGKYLNPWKPEKGGGQPGQMPTYANKISWESKGTPPMPPLPNK